MKLYNRIKNKVLSIYASYLFGNKVYVFGMYKVGNSKNIRMGNNTKINYGVYIQGRYNVEIGENVVLSARCMIFDSGLDVKQMLLTDRLPHIKSYVKIEDNVWVGAGAIILPGVTIGHHSVIAAGSIITKDVPPYSLYGGNPGRIIKNLN